MNYRHQNQGEGRRLYNFSTNPQKPNFTVQKYKESFLKHTTFALGLVG